MVKIEVNGNDGKTLFSGKPDDVAVDIAAAVNQIYKGMFSMHPYMAYVFKKSCETLFREDSPVWDRNGDQMMVSFGDMTMVSYSEKGEESDGDPGEVPGAGDQGSL